MVGGVGKNIFGLYVMCFLGVVDYVIVEWVSWFDLDMIVN